MNWIILVLTATVIWSIAGIINKFCRVSYIESSLGYLIFIAPASFFAAILLLFEPFTLLPAKEAFFALLTGVAITIGYYLYLEAIHKEEISKVFILFGVGPLFVLVLSTIFLKEVLTIHQYIAFALIFIGSTLMLFKRIEHKIKLTFGALLVLLSSFFFSVQDVILKYISKVNLTTMMFYREAGYLASILIILLISPKARKHTKKVITDLNLKQTALVYGAEMMGMTGVFFAYLAIQRGPVSLVKVMHGFETIFVMIFTVILSLYFPKIIKEELNLKTIAIKMISIVLMLGGLFLIAVK
ncbi:DMT family transporter [Candidatus Woesearchaeota archaeon]|nr:DMT family transporter [Candidatus Woesearchaeota archaeon]